MSYLILGFITGVSLILAIGAQNIFVIEQGLKKEYTFIVCLICSISDFILIFLGIFVFYYFEFFFTPIVEFILNVLLLIFLLHFIWSKINIKVDNFNLNIKKYKESLSSIILKTLGQQIKMDNKLGNFWVIYLIAARMPPGQVKGGCRDDGLLGSLGCLVCKCSCVVRVAWVAGIATLIVQNYPK